MPAQYLTGTAVGPGAVDQYLLALRASMVANGWTEIDVISTTSGSRDTVLKSTAIDPTADNVCIVRLSQSSSTALNLRCYTDWDVTLHAGANEAGASTAQSTLQDASFAYFIRVNEFAIATVAKITGPAYHKGYAGMVRRGLPASKAGCTKTTTGYAIGVLSMAVASDMTGKLKIGQKVQIYNHSGASGSANFTNSETMTIATIGTSTLTFTAATTKAYDSGAVIGAYPFPFCVIYLLNVAALSATSGYQPLGLGGQRTSVTGQTITWIQQMLGTETNMDPGDISGEYGAGVIAGTATYAANTGFTGYPYHYECCAAGSQVVEDVMDDGDNLYTVVSVNGTTDTLLLGPQ